MLSSDLLALPERFVCKEHVIESMSRYWDSNLDSIVNLPIPEKIDISIELPLRLKEIKLPEWAAHCGIDGIILVPEEVVGIGSDEWYNIDWWMVAFLYLEAWHERIFEVNNNSIHSYSFRLKNWDTRAWDYAWVNRIAMFFRSWAAKRVELTEKELFGELPLAEIIMTHDVDAVDKTLAIRIKQAVFNSFNALRALYKFRLKDFYKGIAHAFIFLFNKEDWWKLDEVITIEKEAGITSHFNFHTDQRPKKFKSWLFDPWYKIDNIHILDFIKRIKKSGFIIGLHPGYDSWNNEILLRNQLRDLSTKIGESVTTCRQHWLRFSWIYTWCAQEQAGLQLDTTLMFNDRPGFRISAAVKYHPWKSAESSLFKLSSLPTILMDSHFYDYRKLNNNEREIEMKKWIDEIRYVHGQAAVLWHPHTLTNTYGWKNGFIQLIKLIK